MKRNIKDVFRSSDDMTIERIAERGNAADNETASRIYNKCLTRMDKDSAQTEMYTAEPVRRAPRFAPAFIAAACAIIVIGAVGVAKKFKAPAPKPVDTAPVIAATGTTVSATDDEHRIVDTTETKAVTVSAANTKAAETAITTVTVKNELWKSTVPAVGAFINTTNTTAGAPKTTARTTAKTTKAPSKTTTANTVTTAKPGEKHMTLAEIEEWERKHPSCMMTRERAILKGYISADSPRVTLQQVKQFITESSNFNEIYKKIRNVQPSCDVNGGSGVNLIEYWVGGSRNDIVIVCPEGENIFHITCNDGNIYSENAIREELYTENRVTTPPEDEENNTIDEAFRTAYIEAPVAGYVPFDDLLMIVQKKGDDIDLSDFAPYTTDDFKLGSDNIVKYEVVDGNNFKVSKENGVYLMLTLGYGKPVTGAQLHNADLTCTTSIFYPNELDPAMISGMKPWFFE